jgi:cytochrome c-type biogenesis protein CcmH/NrfG
MKRTIMVIAVCACALGIMGCKQDEKTPKVSYTGAPMQTPMPDSMQIDRLQQAVKASPKNAQAWIELGNVLMDAQRYGEAVDAYGKGLALDPKNVGVLVDQGTCYRGIGKFDKAVEQYRKAIAIDPQFPNGHRNLAVVLAYDLHKTNEAIKEFQKYVEVAPNAPDAAQIRQTIQDLSKGAPSGK